MNRSRLRDAAQLINNRTVRVVLTYAYLVIVVALLVIANYTTRDEVRTHPDNVVEVVFLVVAVVLLSSADVRIERGSLSLAGIAMGAATILLNPLDATLVGLSLGIPMFRRGRWRMFANGILAAGYVFVGATIAGTLRNEGSVSFLDRILVLASYNVCSWVMVGAGMSLLTAEPIRSIVRHNFTASFYLAFAYFAAAALLTSYLLDGSLLGYFLASIVLLLALALTDTIAGRRVRRVLESELSDADRHLFHSRAVEGVVHNVRNHIATAVGFLKEIDLNRLDEVDREAVETATTAASDAVTVLRTLSQGATPRVAFAREPVDLNELVALALGMARPRARSKETVLSLRESSDEVKVKADPLLLREVVTNLINNAIDAAPQKGKVDVTVGKRGSSSYVTVADDGAGVAEENRHHLFEPHYTTKESGTGLGLFMSFGVVREHQGELLYSGSSRGAVFTVVLPPFPG